MHPTSGVLRAELLHKVEETTSGKGALSQLDLDQLSLTAFFRLFLPSLKVVI
jgi:hypothetical protein